MKKESPNWQPASPFDESERPPEIHPEPEKSEPEGKEAVITKERSPQEVQKMKDWLLFVAKALTDNPNIKVIPDHPPAGERPNWQACLSEKFQEYYQKHPEKNLEEFDEELFKPAMLKYPEEDLSKKSEDYIWGVFRHEIGHIKHTDFRSFAEAQKLAKQEGYNPLDAFVIHDAWEDPRSDGLESKTSKAAKYRIGTYLKEDIASALLLDFEKKPLPIQYAALCWAKGAESLIEGFNFEELKSKIKDEKVLEAYEKTQDVLAEYLKEPNGRKAFKDIFWENGWPVFKELIDKHLEDEAKKRQQESQAETEKPSKGRRSWDDLSPEEKNQYQKDAREKLNQEEKDFIKHLQSGSFQLKEREDGTIEVKPRIATAEDIKRAEAEERKQGIGKREWEREIQEARKKEAEGLEESLERLKERESGLTEAQRALYESYYNPVRKYVNLLVERLDEVFPLQEEAEWESGHYRGKRIDTKKMAREISIERGKFFKKKETPEIKEAAFTLLNDASGSMRGAPIKSDIMAKVMVAEAFSRKGIPFEMLAFHSKIIEIKKFDEPYDGKVKLRLIGLVDEVIGSASSRTDLGFANDLAARRLQKRLLENNAQGALIVMTDGGPAPPPEHSGPEWELHGIVNKWSKQIPLIGVGIGPLMETTIKEYYGKNGLPVPDIGKLALALLKILKKQIARFESRTASGG